MDRKWSVTTVLAAALVTSCPGLHAGLSAWSGEGKADTKSSSIRAVQTHTVHMKGNSFEPRTLVIQVGDSVLWVNDDPVPHTATRTVAPAFDTGLLTNQSNPTAIQFTQASDDRGFEYFCIPHSSVMRGHIVVKLPDGRPVHVDHSTPRADLKTKVQVPRDAKTVQVRIRNFAYDPPTVEVQVGDSVEWINDDAAPHTATHTDAPAFDTGFLTRGGPTGIVRFDQATSAEGIEYVCTPHPFMKGRVVVKFPGSHLADVGHVMPDDKMSK